MQTELTSGLSENEWVQECEDTLVHDHELEGILSDSSGNVGTTQNCLAALMDAVKTEMCCSDCDADWDALVAPTGPCSDFQPLIDVMANTAGEL